MAWLAIVVSVGLVYSVPVVGVVVAYLLGRHQSTSSSGLLVRRLAYLAVASRSLFVLIGVVFYLLHSTNGDSVFWSILWLTALAAAAWSNAARKSRREGELSPAPPKKHSGHRESHSGSD